MAQGRQPFKLPLDQSRCTGSHANTHDGPTFRQFVKGSPLVRRCDRIAHLRCQNTGAKPQRGCPAGDCGQGVDGTVGGGRPTPHHRVMHPDRIETHGFGFYRRPHEISQFVRLAGDPGHVVD